MVSKEVEQLLLKVQKPGRYVGGEPNSVVKKKDEVNIRFAFCFPDVYEIGMSHLGMKILYGLYNSVPDVWCERVFAPWPDMEAKMRENHIPLYGLESGDSLSIRGKGKFKIEGVLGETKKHRIRISIIHYR